MEVTKIKKEIFIVILILVVIVITDILLEKTTENNFDIISNQLYLLETKLLEEDIIANNKNTDENLINNYVQEFEKVHNKWKEKYDLYACFIEHDELEKVELQMYSINASLKVGDFAKTVDEIERCRFIIKHIEDKDSLRIVNIF